MENKNLTYEQLLQLLTLYQEEWKFQDQLHWSQMYRAFYITLIFMVLPYIATGVGVDISSFQIVKVIFPVIGCVLAVFSFFISSGYIKKVDAVIERYDTLIEYLPEQYRRREFHDRHVRGIYRIKRSYLICYALLVLSIALGVALIYIGIANYF